MSRMDFGITIACYAGDRDLLSGCLSSVRDFYPSTPICLIPHGSVNIGSLMKRYGATYIDPGKVGRALRAKSYGYGLTKMLAFWHAPFERFLHIDADTVCWGRFFDPSWLDGADFIANSSHEQVTNGILREQYFETEAVPPRWMPSGLSRDTLFNTGTFASHTGLFSLGDYLELVDWMKAKPGSIFTDQGILNLMVQAKLTSKDFRFVQKDLQAIVAVSEADTLNSRFKIGADGPIVRDADAKLIHWAGPKPRRGERLAGMFSGPMDYYRLKHLKLEKLYPSKVGPLIVDATGALMNNFARAINKVSSKKPRLRWTADR